MVICSPAGQDADFQNGDMKIDTADQTTAERIAGGREQLKIAPLKEGPQSRHATPVTKLRVTSRCPDWLTTEGDVQVAIVAVEGQIACPSRMLPFRQRMEHSSIYWSLQSREREARDAAAHVFAILSSKIDVFCFWHYQILPLALQAR